MLFQRVRGKELETDVFISFPNMQMMKSSETFEMEGRKQCPPHCKVKGEGCYV